MSLDPISVWIDDRDSRVRFSGVWRIGGVREDFNETVSSSTRVGDSFVVPFYGQSIVVYGTIDASSGGVVTNYSIDGAPPVQMTSQRGAVDTGKQQFWASPSLNVSQHELSVTMAKVNYDTEEGEGTIWFDYFTVYDPSGHERMPSKKTLSKGVMAGAVMGGVICFTLLLLGAYFWIRKRRLRRKDETHQYRYYAGDKDLQDYTQEKRGDLESLWTLGARRKSSRNVIQPYALEPPISLNSLRKTNGDLPQLHSAARKSRAISAPEETGSGRDRNDNLRSQSPSSRLPENIVAGATIFLNARDLPSSITRHVHKNIPSSEAHSLRTTNAFASPSGSRGDDRAVGLEATLPNPASVADINHGGSGDLTSVNCARSSSALTSDLIPPADAERATSSPGTGGDVAHSTNAAIHTEQTEDGELRSRSMIQHVDSGIRLGTEELGLPIELPPVYSPT